MDILFVIAVKIVSILFVIAVFIKILVNYGLVRFTLAYYRLTVFF